MVEIKWLHMSNGVRFQRSLINHSLVLNNIKMHLFHQKTGDLGNMAPGSPWPVLKTMPNSKQPVKGYYLFDQAQVSSGNSGSDHSQLFQQDQKHHQL